MSQEVSRHGGRQRYRAAEADAAAWEAARRPKRCLLALNHRLRRLVAGKLRKNCAEPLKKSSSAIFAASVGSADLGIRAQPAPAAGRSSMRSQSARDRLRSKVVPFQGTGKETWLRAAAALISPLWLSGKLASSCSPKLRIKRLKRWCRRSSKRSASCQEPCESQSLGTEVWMTPSTMNPTEGPIDAFDQRNRFSLVGTVGTAR